MDDISWNQSLHICILYLYLYVVVVLFCQQAESHVSKYCRSELKGKECIVCSGHMTVHINDESD